MAAMGISRALTGHARRRYANKYKGRYRTPRITFIIDAVLIGVVALLMGTLLWTLTLPEPKSGLRMTLKTPPVVAGDALPFMVTLDSADGLPHQNVRVRWHLPSGSEILEADPPIALDGTSFLGNVSPIEGASAHVVIRTFVPEGEKAVFGFTVTYDNGAQERMFFGEGIREVATSALTATVPEPFRTEFVAAQGAAIPIRVENATDRTLPFAYLRLERSVVSPEERTIPLGDLPPKSIRWVYVDIPDAYEQIPGDLPPFAWLEWSVGAASRDLSSGFWQAKYASRTVPFPSVTGNLTSRPSAPTTLALSSTEETSDVIIMHPLLPEPTARITVHSTGQFTIPPIQVTESPNHEWFVAPIIGKTLGPATYGTIHTDLPFATQIRYQSSAGDQLGAGPLPPRAGIETRYWVFWTVGPIDSALESIAARTTLPPGVTATGNVTVPDGGTYTAIGRTVTWSLPSLGAERARALFGFEIAVTPSADQVGAPLTLIDTVAASAFDTHTNLQFTAQTSAIQSTLEEFGSDTSKGIVSP